MDLVLNHTSDEHVWFKGALKRRARLQSSLFMITIFGLIPQMISHLFLVVVLGHMSPR